MDNKIYKVDADGVLFLVIAISGLEAINAIKKEVEALTGDIVQVCTAEETTLEQCNILFPQDLNDESYKYSVELLVLIQRGALIIACSEHE